MVKTKIIETTEKYDKDGKLVEKVTREETSEDNTNYTSNTINPEDVAKSVKEYVDKYFTKTGFPLF